MKKGFTLIELLVVVLIIGTLTAVAMPQYQTALLKSRLGAAIPIAEALKVGAELDYTETRQVPTSSADLPIAPPANCQRDDNGKVVCPNMYLLVSSSAGVADVMVFVPTRARAEIGYRAWLNVPPNEEANRAGRRECLAVSGNERAAQVCRGLTRHSKMASSSLLDKTWDVYPM